MPSHKLHAIWNTCITLLIVEVALIVCTANNFNPELCTILFVLLFYPTAAFLTISLFATSPSAPKANKQEYHCDTEPIDTEHIRSTLDKPGPLIEHTSLSEHENQVIEALRYYNS